MTAEPRLDIIGAALADSSRSRILCTLMDGRAFTNKELASAANISPQTASAHLKQLRSAGLTSSQQSGRHVYHRIANAEVASVLERLATLSPMDHLARSPRRDSTGMARSCYNHIAGRLGVLMTERLVALNVLLVGIEHAAPGPHFQSFLDDLDLDLPRIGAGKPTVRLCLDWTERRHHISGPFATEIMKMALDKGWLARNPNSRALLITGDGYDGFQRHFGLSKEALTLIETD